MESSTNIEQEIDFYDDEALKISPQEQAGVVTIMRDIDLRKLERCVQVSKGMFDAGENLRQIGVGEVAPHSYARDLQAVIAIQLARHLAPCAPPTTLESKKPKEC